MVSGGLCVFASGCAPESAGPKDEVGRLLGHIYIHFSHIGVPGATVSVAGHSQQTGPDGAYDFDDIPVGLQEVLVSAEAYRPTTRTVNVSAYQVVDIELVPLDAYGRLSGVVDHRLDGALAAVAVSVADSTALTDRFGRFTIEGVPHGQHTVRFDLAGYNVDLIQQIIFRDQHELQHTMTRDTTFTLPITVDTYVHVADPDSFETNYGHRPRLNIDDDPGRLALLKTPVTNFPYAWGRVKSAELNLYCVGDWVELDEDDEGGPVAAQQQVPLRLWMIPNHWWEGTVHHDNFPGADPLVTVFDGENAPTFVAGQPIPYSITIPGSFMAALPDSVHHGFILEALSGAQWPIYGIASENPELDLLHAKPSFTFTFSF